MSFVGDQHPTIAWTSLVAKKNSSGRGDEAPHRLHSLLRFLFCSHDLGRPVQRQEGRRADEKDNALAGAGVPDLDIEVESPFREMSTSRKQYQVVELGSPQRSRPLEAVSRVDFYAVTPQDARPHVASAPVGIDEENSLVIETRATKWWWLVHPTLPKLARFPSEGSLAGFSSWRDGSQGKWKSPERRLRALGSCDSGSGFVRGGGGRGTSGGSISE
jgi:hypothetical protein